MVFPPPGIHFVKMQGPCGADARFFRLYEAPFFQPLARGGAGLGLGSGLLGGIQDPAGAFIFASYAEELGLIGILALLFLIFLVAILGARTVSRAKERGDIVSAVIVSGIVLSVILRFIISMAYCAGFLPLPGVLLPFFSYAPSEEFIAVMLSVILYRLIHLMGREHEKK